MNEDIKDETIEEVEETEERFTKEEFEERLQSETDKRVTSAIKKREETLKAEMKAQIEKERKEAEELAKLSEKERATKELELKEQELEEERRVFYKERLELQTSKELDKLGLPITFTEYVMGDNAEETQERLSKFNELWETELEKRRLESLRGETPKSGGTKKMTKESILAIGDPIERKRKIAENMDLFE